jgi:hypothetical protein
VRVRLTFVSTPSATRCATVSRDLAEPPAATASIARTWLLLEQPGPWGAKAFSSSHLDPQVGRTLEQAAGGTGVRLALIRRPGRHSDSHRPDRRRVFAAHTVPGAGWVREAVIGDPAELLGLDFAGLGGGSHGGFGAAYEGEPLAAVCTNGRRDRCCAISGRPLAAELAASGLGQVWEVTHLGGHRFSPTMLVLPHGYSYGRLDTAHAKAVLEATRDGRMVPDLCRGRSTWERPGQAAELAVRRATGETRAEALSVTGTRENAEPAGGSVSGWTVDVAHADGRAWAVEVAGASVPPRPESCGADPVPSLRMEVRSVEPR